MLGGSLAPTGIDTQKITLFAILLITISAIGFCLERRTVKFSKYFNMK